MSCRSDRIRFFVSWIDMMMKMMWLVPSFHSKFGQSFCFAIFSWKKKSSEIVLICQALAGRMRPGRGGLLKTQNFNFKVESHFFQFFTKFMFLPVQTFLKIKFVYILWIFSWTFHMSHMSSPSCVTYKDKQQLHWRVLNSETLKCNGKCDWKRNADFRSKSCWTIWRWLLNDTCRVRKR